MASVVVKPSPEYDFAVVGGGLVGMAVAWGLARRGRRTVVLDEGDVAWRASRGNFALVWVQSKGAGMSEYARWTMASAQRWPALAAALAQETGLDVRYRRPGGLHLLLSEREVESRANALKRAPAQPTRHGGLRVCDARPRCGRKDAAAGRPA